jgi:hypothetical protein
MPGMMRMMHRMMRHDARHAAMMRLIFILMDTDGDGALSLDEVQSVAERIFNAIDADDDGQVTLDEIRGVLSRHDSGSPQQMQMPMRKACRCVQGMQMDLCTQPRRPTWRPCRR